MNVINYMVYLQIPSCIPKNLTPGPSGKPVYFTGQPGKVTGYGTVTPRPSPRPTARPTQKPTLRPGETYAPTPSGQTPTQKTSPPTPMPRPSKLILDVIYFSILRCLLYKVY